MIIILCLLKRNSIGNLEEYDRDNQENITKKESSQDLLDPEGDKYNKLQSQLDRIKFDTKIFEQSSRVLSKEYIYKIDGLVFTPVNLVKEMKWIITNLNLMADGTNCLNGNLLKKILLILRYL